MIKVISFDIGGTLIKGVNNQYTMTEFSKITNRDYYDVKKAYQDIFQKREGSFDELVNLFCQRLNIPVNEEINKFLLDNFNQDCYFDKDSLTIIRELKELGYKIILFSNSSNLYPDTLDKEIYDLVDDIFYSYKIGHTKDESESYRFIESKMKCKSNEILHIGDSLENDYLFPIKNGWNAILYGNNKDVKSLSNLSDIFEVLKEDL